MSGSGSPAGGEQLSDDDDDDDADPGGDHVKHLVASPRPFH